MNNLHPSPRLTAANVWMRWLKGGSFAETLINAAARREGLSSADRALTQAIVYGILRNRLWLEHILKTLRPQGLDADLNALCLVGLCQIFIMGLPPHAAVSETVKLIPKRTRGVVNAILRASLRQRDEIEAEREKLPLSVRFSTPQWLVERWIQQFGAHAAQQLLEWNNSTPEIHARANALKPTATAPEGFIPMQNMPGWYRIDGIFPIDVIKKGEFYLADPSTRYSVELLAPLPGEKILDACAAPGGKTAAILSLTENSAFVTATDGHDYRLPMIKDNLSRLGAQSAEIEVCNWEAPCPDDKRGQFDAALLDVPCSNTGVIQRRVDVRWRLSADEITRLADVQQTIMQNAACAVRPGGRMVYSTCSIDREENRDNVERFLSNHSEWTFESDRLILPHEEHADGAYCALLRRAVQ